jgi:branched-chain amino acid transport system permease protein
MATFIALLASGIALGAIFALGALGFLVLYKATGVISFAHGDLITLGAYIAIWATVDLHFPTVVGYLVAIGLLLLVGLLLERVAYAPLRGKSVHVVVISTLGAALVIRAIIGIWQGTLPRSLASPVGQRVWRVAGANISYQRILIVGVTGIAVFALLILFNRTSLGRQVRALAADPQTARLQGIRMTRMSMMAWALSAGVAGLAGVLVGPLSAVDLNLGFGIMLNSFAAAILGGFGSLEGVVVAGLVLGIVNQTFGGYYLRDYKDAYPFVVMILVIAFRPQGLFSRPTSARL